MTLKNKILFASIIAIVMYLLSEIFLNKAIQWDHPCGYKEEFGLFKFYRVGSDTGPREFCESGILWLGLLKTMILTVLITSPIYLFWKKVISK